MSLKFALLPVLFLAVALASSPSKVYESSPLLKEHEAPPMSTKMSEKERISRNAFAGPQFDAYGPPVHHPEPHIPHYKPDIKVLPLPIPIGLPVPVHGKHGYGHGYGYGHEYYPEHVLYHDGLFAGFGKKYGDGKYANKLGYDVIRASFLSSRSNPLVHLLAAPYLKNVREHGGKDLPTIYELQDLLEQAAFGLTHVDHHDPHHHEPIHHEQPYVAKRKDTQ